MNAQQLKQDIDRIESMADEAKNAAQGGNVPQDLRNAIDALHQQARQAKHGGASDESALTQVAMQLEQQADRAMQACRTAGNVDPKLQQAVQKVHTELSNLKHQLKAGSAA